MKSRSKWILDILVFLDSILSYLDLYREMDITFRCTWHSKLISVKIIYRKVTTPILLLFKCTPLHCSCLLCPLSKYIHFLTIVLSRLNLRKFKAINTVYLAISRNVIFVTRKFYLNLCKEQNLCKNYVYKRETFFSC